MKIGIVDADLLGRKKHRFPNLACEKISSYYKQEGHDTKLVLDYNELYEYDKVFISKVFTDTAIPAFLQESDAMHLGGTGFFFDKAPNLPEDIEHQMPDYHLYDQWIKNEVRKKQSLCKHKGKTFNERLCHNKWLIFDEKYRIIIVRNSTTEGGNWICLLSKTH